MEKLEEGKYYHIYNRGINSAPIFKADFHFNVFIRWYFFYTCLVLETFAYTLMENHFHFLIKVRNEEEQKELFSIYRNRYIDDNKSWLPHGCDYQNFKKLSASRQISHLFNRYSKNFNKWNKRTGKLFETPFKRKRITDEDYLRQLVCYIHRNPVHHGISSDYDDYPYSSYSHFFNLTDAKLQRDQVLQWFGDILGFKAAHKEMKLKITPEFE